MGDIRWDRKAVIDSSRIRRNRGRSPWRIMRVTSRRHAAQHPETSWSQMKGFAMTDDAHASDCDTLRRRIEVLEHVCAEAYQFAGEVGAPVRVLDNLAAAAHGESLPHASILPITADECDEIGGLRAKLARVREAANA